VPPIDWGIHTVQPGNTILSLADRYGISVDALLRVNCLNTHTIFAGQRLYVPGQLASPTDLAPIGTPLAGSQSSRTNVDELDISAIETAVAPLPTLTPKPALPVSVPAHYLNIVLLGCDRRPGSGAWRTDSIIIASVDTENSIVRLLSIPRDLWVYIPGHGYNRINTADLWGELAAKGTGPDWVKRTIHHNLGIPIHHYVRVDFKGFIEIIDAVGGIDVDVACPLSDINLSAGLQHMGGKEALRFARSRYSTNDFDRGRRQRKILMALWDQALSMDLVLRLPQLWRTLADSFQTDLSLEQVLDLAYVATQLKPQHIFSRSIGPAQVQGWRTPQGAAVLLPRTERITTELESFFAPVDSRQVDRAAEVLVRILNGAQRLDADRLAASSLHWSGFKVEAGGPADHQTYAQTQIAYFSGDADSAKQIARLLRVPITAIQDLSGIDFQPDPANPVDIQVILGYDYNPCQR
jgi:LCP family protein required for cell wall assembly